MTILDYIRNEIITLGYPNVYIGSYNDDYDNIVAIKYIEPMKGSTSTFATDGAETAIRHFEIEIKVRNTSFDTGFTCLEAIRTHFSAHKYSKVDIIAKSDMLTKGNDEKNRSIVVIQFHIKAIGGTTL